MVVTVVANRPSPPSRKCLVFSHFLGEVGWINPQNGPLGTKTCTKIARRAESGLIPAVGQPYPFCRGIAAGSRPGDRVQAAVRRVGHKRNYAPLLSLRLGRALGQQRLPGALCAARARAELEDGASRLRKKSAKGQLPSLEDYEAANHKAQESGKILVQQWSK